MSSQTSTASQSAGHDDVNSTVQGQTVNHKTVQQAYVRAIVSRSHQTKATSLFPGHNYKALADFISQRIEHGTSRNDPREHVANFDTQPLEFVTVHDYTNGDKVKISHYGSNQAEQERLVAYQRSASCHAQLLFIQGFARSAWLSALGCCLEVDPAFFRMHLDFLQTEPHFDLPTLPSAMRHIVTLSVTTITINKTLRPSNQSLLLGERWNAQEGTSSWLRDIVRTGVDGDSIFRRLSVINEQYCTIDQRISVCLQRRARGWTAVIWLDHGHELFSRKFTQWNRLPGSMRAGQYVCLPVYQNPSRTSSSDHSPDMSGNNPSLPYLNDTLQSPSSLPRFYGQTSDPNIARCDAFYALSELFSFCAYSECQFLNMVAYAIEEQAEPLIERMQDSLSNLQYIKAALREHLQNIRASTSYIQARGGLDWPRTKDQEQIKTVELVAKGLHEDYAKLIERAHLLLQRCDDDTLQLTNRAMLAEAQRSYWQAWGMTRLTFLASFFVPLSFTSSFFGMNFKEFQNADGPRLSIWTWWTTTAPIFITVLILCFWPSVKSFTVKFGRRVRRTFL